MAENQPKMPDVGPIGRNLIAAVEELREARGLSYRKLSEKLDEAGRPIFPLGLSRLARGQRRVDVDELAALALTLGVAPSALLLPRDVDVSDQDATIQLTENIRVPAAAAWLWMDGQEPLPQESPELDSDENGSPEVHQTPSDRLGDYLRHSRPKGSYGDRHPAAEAAYNLTKRLSVLLQDMGNPHMWDLYNNFLTIWYERLGLELRALMAENEALARQASPRTRPAYSAPSSGDTVIDEELKLAEMIKRTGGEWTVRDREGGVRPVVKKDAAAESPGADGGAEGEHG